MRKREANDRPCWEPRDQDLLAKQLSSTFGVPVDMSSTAGGLKAICNALNDGDVARAQIATILLGIPDPPRCTKAHHFRDEMIKFIRALHRSGLIRWDHDGGKRSRSRAEEQNHSELEKAGFDPDQPRDQRGRWSTDSEGGANGSDYELVADTASTFDAARRKRPNPELEELCKRLYDSDTEICNSLRDKQERKVCHSSAAQRYGACLSGHQIPPLTLPLPDEPEQPAPAPRARQFIPPRPPWWLPLLLLPLPAGIPA